MAKATSTPTFDPTDEQSAREAAEAQADIDGTRGPAGYAAREALANRAEELIARAQEMLAQLDIHTADSNDLEVENEVRQALNEMNEVYVSNALEDHVYSWVFRDPHNEFGGRYVRRMQALGWEIVAHDMPEAKEHRAVDGTRWVSDCLLMRLRIDRRVVLDQRDRILRQAQQEGITSRVIELAQRAGTRVYDKLPDFVQQGMSATADRQRAARAAFHRMNAGGKVDRMLKTGTIPGVPVPGAGTR